MDTNELIILLKQNAQLFAESYSLINGSIMNLDEVRQMGYQEFALRSKSNMPLKLYKYFPNSTIINDGKELNYSIQALKNNTVFMQSPSNFDDVYDSDINIDYNKYERLRLIEYCERCQIKLEDTLSTQEIGRLLINAFVNSFKSAGNFNSAFTRAPKTEIEELSNENFFLRLSLELNKNGDLGIALGKIIQSDFIEHSDYLKNIFRITCFATTPYSQLMWGGSYADCHRGFCIEYTILPDNELYRDIYLNLFPMIYCKKREDITERIVRLQDRQWNEDDLWDIYLNGVLRKSFDWAFQNEWRLLMPMKHKDASDYNIQFFPITKVFLGNRMPKDKRREIIDICNKKSIPYIGVVRNPGIFEMQSCNVKCEECFRCAENIDSN